MRSRTLLILPAAAVLALTASAGSSSGDSVSSSSSSSAASSSGGDVTCTLTVFAAASLTDVFTDLGNQLEKDDPGLEVRFNCAGSDALATQSTQGAPADVFASANQKQMKVVTDAGLQAADPTVFADNVL